MSYSAKYIDENGDEREVIITDEDSQEALNNDFKLLKRTYNPKIVRIQRLQTSPGEELHLLVTVKAPTHYLCGPDDFTPKPCNEMSVHVVCYRGYPLVRVKAYYERNHRLASYNVFASGDACIDNWIFFKSSLNTVVDKLVRDIVHDTNISRPESPACSALIKWYEEERKARKFPTIPPKALFALDTVALPPRRVTSKPVIAPPPLPGRRH